MVLVSRRYFIRGPNIGALTVNVGSLGAATEIWKQPRESHCATQSPFSLRGTGHVQLRPVLSCTHNTLPHRTWKKRTRAVCVVVL